MAHKIIKTENYLLVVDDSEIKRGYWFYLDDAVVIARYNESKPVSSAKKIIAHLPLNGSPILEGVDLLPPLEDDIEQLAKEWYDTEVFSSSHIADINSFKEGYNKAREKYKYTEEDVVHLLHKTARKYFQEGREYKGNMAIAGDPLHGVRRELINMVQSLHQYPTEFDCEMKYFEVDMGLGEECIEYGQIPQKITTAKGVQWVGKYKYHIVDVNEMVNYSEIPNN